ncbi:MAG: hypothetical protein U9R60_16670 [Bacteroidota bacterium]|nr:hypothetical protein [Bacteroidota bacterium]
MVALKVTLKLIQPSIEILNLRIDEPITVATDLLLAAICFYAFFRIRKRAYSGRVKWYFKYYFLTLGLGAAFGGIFGHAFQYRLSEEWKLLSWVLTLGSVALIAHALVELAKPLVKPGISRFVSLFNLLVFVLALIYTIWTVAFSPVKYYMIFGMLVVVGSFSYFIYRKTGSRGMLILIGAVLAGFISAIIFNFEWGLGPWFNHRDISHLILSFSAFGFYRGAVLIMDSSVIGP